MRPILTVQFYLDINVLHKSQTSNAKTALLSLNLEEDGCFPLLLKVLSSFEDIIKSTPQKTAYCGDCLYNPYLYNQIKKKDFEFIQIMCFGLTI